MLAKLIKTALFPALLLTLGATAAMAQVGSLQGEVLDGSEGVVGAKILIERTDIPGNYSVKTKKKGRWFHAGCRWAPTTSLLGSTARSSTS